MTDWNTIRTHIQPVLVVWAIVPWVILWVLLYDNKSTLSSVAAQNWFAAVAGTCGLVGQGIKFHGAPVGSKSRLEAFFATLGIITALIALWART